MNSKSGPKNLPLYYSLPWLNNSNIVVENKNIGRRNNEKRETAVMVLEKYGKGFRFRYIYVYITERKCFLKNIFALTKHGELITNYTTLTTFFLVSLYYCGKQTFIIEIDF